MKQVVMIVILAVTLVLDGTGSHNTGERRSRKKLEGESLAGEDMGEGFFKGRWVKG